MGLTNPNMEAEGARDRSEELARLPMHAQARRAAARGRRRAAAGAPQRAPRGGRGGAPWRPAGMSAAAFATRTGELLHAYARGSTGKEAHTHTHTRTHARARMHARTRARARMHTRT
jgi:hypothetical protein